MVFYHISRPGKSGHLDNLDTFCRSQGVHNTQVPLYITNITQYGMYTGKYWVNSLLLYLLLYHMARNIGVELNLTVGKNNCVPPDLFHQHLIFVL